jgi:predicted dehydrogenase
MKIPFALVGAGWIADFYVKALADLDDTFTLVGCSGNPSQAGRERLEKKCAEWGVKAYNSYDEILSDKNIKAVCIFSPTYLHYEQAKQAMEHGKHLLVEKPVALETEQLDELQNLARKKDLVIFPGHNFVYRPVIRKAKEIIASKALGTISYASFRASHFIPHDHAVGWRKDFTKSGGGAMMDSGTHLVYQMLYLLGEPQWLSCIAEKHHYTQMDGEDTCQISLRLSNGIVGQIFQSWSAADDSAGEIRIQGDSGVLLITDALYFNGECIETDSSYESSFYHTLKAFGKAVNEHVRPLSDVGAALTTLKLIQAAYSAAANRSIIQWRNS